MKAFLEEYGLAIFAIACVTVLVAMADPIGSAVQTALLAAVNSFTAGALG